MYNIKKVRPMANYLITTKEEYTEDELKVGNFISRVVNTMKEFQTVVAVGPMVRGIQVGDLVCINPKRYAVLKHKEGSLKDGVITDNPVTTYRFNVIELDHVPHLLLTDQDISYVVEEWEEKVQKSNIFITPETKIIAPPDKIITN